jgi:hypothetical protein
MASNEASSMFALHEAIHGEVPPGSGAWSGTHAHHARGFAAGALEKLNTVIPHSCCGLGMAAESVEGHGTQRKAQIPRSRFHPCARGSDPWLPCSETSPKCLNHVELMPFQDIVLLRAVGLQFRRLISSSKRVSWIGGEECPC